MPHNTQEQVLESLFIAWSEGQTLTKSELAKLEASPVWSQKMVLINALNEERVAADESLNVPEWDIANSYTHGVRLNQGHERSWWNNNGLSMLAMSCSILVACLFAFDMRISGSQLEAQQAKYLEWQNEQKRQFQAELLRWTKDSNNELLNSLQKFEKKQSDNTAKLANYLIENSRIERQEDMQRIVQAIQNQRSEDLQYVQSEIENLQYKLSLATYNNNSIGNTNGTTYVSEE